MATGTRTTDSFPEGLRKLMGSITDLKMSDDADLPFVINLETQVLSRMKQGANAAMGPQGPPPGAGIPVGGPGGVTAGVPGMAPAGPPGMPVGPGMAAPGIPPGMPPPGMPPNPAAGPAIGPAAVPGLMQGPSIPPVDELRRMLSHGNTALRLNNVAQRLGGLVA